MEPHQQIRLWEPLLFLIGAALLILWVINTFNTGNPLWFIPIQPSYEPSRLVIRNYGETITLLQGEPGYDEIAAALTETFNQGFENTALVPLGLSEETLRRYNEEELVLEAYYPDTVQFNTPVRMRGVNQLLIPIDATHDGSRYLFIGANGQWRAGVMVMEDDSPILNTMAQLGYGPE